MNIHSSTHAGKKWGDVIFTGRGTVWTNFLKRISTWWFNGLNFQFYVFFLAMYFQKSNSKPDFAKFAKVICAHCRCVFWVCNFWNAQKFHFGTRNSQKAKRKWRELPLFFDFFVLKCTYMETYNSHPEFYGNIKGHATILWKHITFWCVFLWKHKSSIRTFMETYNSDFTMD